jgi:preprotein translocase subunit SecA
MESEKKKFVQYYETREERKQVHLTHEGIAEAQRAANLGSFYVGENMDLPHLLEQALRAHVVYQLDKDYIVGPAENPNTGRTEPSIIIVDTSTGRPMVGRQWSDGLHQAVEAKEGVPIKQENQTVATITIQNFFKMYKRLAGMTGTADTEAQEFYDIYKLDVVAIPTNKPVRRRDFDDLVFLTQKDKWTFIVDEIKNFHDVGRPVLVGTTSVEKSEMLAKELQRRYQIKHEVLNAKQHEREAHIVENAGALGAVMIATNMAGRGTDIKLQPISRESLLRHWQLRSIAPRDVPLDCSDDTLRELCFRKLAPGVLDIPKREIESMPFADLELRLLKVWAAQNTFLTDREIERADAESLRQALDAKGRFLLHRLRWFPTIEDLGGLHVVGTERHESRRIDNQLRGRSGRQGDKGSTRFFISLEDELMKLFGGETTMRVLARLGMKEGDAIEHPILSKSVERAQRKVEEINFQRRKHILEYDEVMEHQRKHFYGLRQRSLEGRDLKGLIFDYIRDAAKDASTRYLAPQYGLECAAEVIKDRLEVTVNPRQLKGLEREELDTYARNRAHEEARGLIKITMGEYLPTTDSEFEMDLDTEGLIKWAKDRYGVELSEKDVNPMTPEKRRLIEDRLGDAAARRLDEVDLSPIDAMLKPDYGASQLVGWAKDKFGFELRTDEISKTMTSEGIDGVVRLMVKQAETNYRVREIEYPVDYSMEMTMALMRQNPAVAWGYLVNWARSRFGLEWNEATLKTRPPAQVRADLIRCSTQFVDTGVIEKEVKAAVACATDDALAEHFRKRFKMELPANMRRLEADERSDKIRSKVESILRSELVFFERSMLLEILDGLWKDHLYAMDQVRDSIGLRAFSQNDPRIAFKKEGSALFNEMMDSVRNRVTDLIFKVKKMPLSMTPVMMAGVMPEMEQPAPAQAAPMARNPYASSAPAGRPTPGTGVPPAGGGAGFSSSQGLY